MKNLIFHLFATIFAFTRLAKHACCCNSNHLSSASNRSREEQAQHIINYKHLSDLNHGKSKEMNNSSYIKGGISLNIQNINKQPSLHTSSLTRKLVVAYPFKKSFLNSRHTEKAQHPQKLKRSDSLQNHLIPPTFFQQFISPNTHQNKEADTLHKYFSSIVKIFISSEFPDFSIPWQYNQPSESYGSGFIIKGKLILTCAHVVTYQTRVLVKKYGDSHRYIATVLAVNHDFDLALLTVNKKEDNSNEDSKSENNAETFLNSEFWEGTIPLEIIDTPKLMDSVRVVGFPEGGDQLSITKGIVSRIDILKYVHSKQKLLTIQIDAAINPGNSGGPTFVNDKVVGVAFQGFNQLQNVGYVIPSSVVKLFLLDIALNKEYTGFASHSLMTQTMENPSLKEHYGVNKITDNISYFSKKNIGILVTFASKTVWRKIFKKRKIPKYSKKIPNEYLENIYENLGNIFTNKHEFYDTGKNDMLKNFKNSLIGEETHDTIFGYSELKRNKELIDAAKDFITKELEEHKRLLMEGMKSFNKLPKVVGLKKGDVILAIDGIDVADDGTIAFRDLERVPYKYIFIGKLNGDVSIFTIIRNKKITHALVPLTTPIFKVPLHTWDTKPKYFIFGGIVFTVLTEALLANVFGDQFPVLSPIALLDLLYSKELQDDENLEIVVILEIIPATANLGYNARLVVVKKVQGTKVKNLNHLIYLIERKKKKHRQNAVCKKHKQKRNFRNNDYYDVNTERNEFVKTEHSIYSYFKEVINYAKYIKELKKCEGKKSGFPKNYASVQNNAEKQKADETQLKEERKVDEETNTPIQQDEEVIIEIEKNGYAYTIIIKKSEAYESNEEILKSRKIPVDRQTD